jgi:hypothetical protein
MGVLSINMPFAPYFITESQIFCHKGEAWKSMGTSLFLVEILFDHYQGEARLRVRTFDVSSDVPARVTPLGVFLSY